MSNSSPETLLTKGLLEGYASSGGGVESQRGGFPIRVIHSESGAGKYHDEYSAEVTGAGQEFSDNGEQKYSRSYAGGTIPLEELTKLGITGDTVLAYLVSKVSELGQKTRLHTSILPPADDRFRYQYEIIEKEPSIPVTVGKESVFYDEVLVFVHYFLLCPIT